MSGKEMVFDKWNNSDLIGQIANTNQKIGISVIRLRDIKSHSDMIIRCPSVSLMLPDVTSSHDSELPLIGEFIANVRLQQTVKSPTLLTDHIRGIHFDIGVRLRGGMDRKIGMVCVKSPELSLFSAEVITEEQEEFWARVGVSIRPRDYILQLVA